MNENLRRLYGMGFHGRAAASEHDITSATQSVGCSGVKPNQPSLSGTLMGVSRFGGYRNGTAFYQARFGMGGEIAFPRVGLSPKRNS